jgi:hypothetical protein
VTTLARDAWLPIWPNLAALPIYSTFSTDMSTVAYAIY